MTAGCQFGSEAADPTAAVGLRRLDNAPMSELVSFLDLPSDIPLLICARRSRLAVFLMVS